MFRLIPSNYHRYHYFDNGKLISQKQIDGRYHTVREVALKRKRVYLENTREYALLQTKNFQKVAYMEVGALGVGRIVNHKQTSFERGDEKGYFAFGGSTIILLFKKGVLKEPTMLLEKSMQNQEAVVKCGERIGERK